MVTGLSFVLYTSAALIAFLELSTLTFWDTESYPADSTASPKRRCAARKTSTERAT